MFRFSFIFLYLFQISFSVQAGIFGPSNYEECVLDGMKNANTENGIPTLRSMCRKKFPLLAKLSINKNSELLCEEVLSKETLVLTVKYDSLHVDRWDKDFSIILRNKDTVRFSGSVIEKSNGLTHKLYGEIDTSIGTTKIRIDNEDGSNDSYLFGCIEK